MRTFYSHTPFNVRLVEAGDRYGRDFCLTHEYEPSDIDKAMVEFYDARFLHTKFGQFVSRYYVSTLLEPYEYLDGDEEAGLDLMGYEPAWKVDGKDMKFIRANLAMYEDGLITKHHFNLDLADEGRAD